VPTRRIVPNFFDELFDALNHRLGLASDPMPGLAEFSASLPGQRGCDYRVERLTVSAAHCRDRHVQAVGDGAPSCRLPCPRAAP
jgi:hypothetical protein